MNTKPILYIGPMVRAILDGRKTQTRRTSGLNVINQCPGEWKLDALLADGTAMFNYGNGYEIKKVRCPYGVPGDLLWLRETWAQGRDGIIYRADGGPPPEGRWKPSIFMPRLHSRLTLRVSNVRVERVQEISLDDLHAEGVACSDCWTARTPYKDFPHPEYCGCRNLFINLWNSIRGPDAWDRNDWVWVVEWDKVWTQNIDQVLKEMAA